MRGLSGQLIGVMFRLPAQLLTFVRFGNTAGLWALAWKFSREPGDASQLLAAISKKDGADAVSGAAERILQEARDCSVAATAGWLELAGRHSAEAADRWVRMADSNQFANQQMLLHLKLYLSAALAKYNAEEIADQILSRNDLPGHVTLAAMIQKANMLLEQKNWKEAEAIADRILGVEPQADAQLIKWITCSADGREAEASRHFVIARGLIHGATFEILAARGFLLLDRKAEAMEHLCNATKQGYKLRSSDTPLGRLAESEEFQNFCKERQ